MLTGVTCDQTLQWLVGSVKSPRDLAIFTAVSNPYKQDPCMVIYTYICLLCMVL